MEGIGNPMFSDPRMAPQPTGIANMTIKDVVSEAKDTVIGMIKDPLARNVQVQVGNRVGGGGVGNMPRPGGGVSTGTRHTAVFVVVLLSWVVLSCIT